MISITKIIYENKEPVEPTLGAKLTRGITQTFPAVVMGAIAGRTIPTFLQPEAPDIEISTSDDPYEIINKTYAMKKNALAGLDDAGMGDDGSRNFLRIAGGIGGGLTAAHLVDKYVPVKKNAKETLKQSAAVALPAGLVGLGALAANDAYHQTGLSRLQDATEKMSTLSGSPEEVFKHTNDMYNMSKNYTSPAYNLGKVGSAVAGLGTALAANKLYNDRNKKNDK